MGKASRKKKERRDDGPGFIEAIQKAQEAQKDKFVQKFGKPLEVTIEGGEMKVRPAREGNKDGSQSEAVRPESPA